MAPLCADLLAKASVWPWRLCSSKAASLPLHSALVAELSQDSDQFESDFQGIRTQFLRRFQLFAGRLVRLASCQRKPQFAASVSIVGTECHHPAQIRFGSAELPRRSQRHSAQVEDFGRVQGGRGSFLPNLSQGKCLLEVAEIDLDLGSCEAGSDVSGIET